MQDTKFRAIRDRVTTTLGRLTLLVTEVYSSHCFSVN